MDRLREKEEGAWVFFFFFSPRARFFGGTTLEGCDSASLNAIAGLKHVLSEFVLRQAYPERRSSFDGLRMSGVEGPALPKP